jgi:hypothetical protein
MRPSSLLLALAAAIGVSAIPYTSIPTPDRSAVQAYLDRLSPVALEVLEHDIGGPSIGADVSPRLLYPPNT